MATLLITYYFKSCYIVWVKSKCLVMTTVFIVCLTISLQIIFLELQCSDKEDLIMLFHAVVKISGGQVLKAQEHLRFLVL